MDYRDPFQNSPDVAAYVARPATEKALAALLDAVRSGEQIVAFAGPAGIGKSFLLHVLAERCRDEAQVVRVPVPSLPPEGLFGWVLATIGVSAGKDPRERLVSEARKSAAADDPLLLVIDDAISLPEDTAVALRSLHAEVVPDMRVVLAVADDVASHRLLELVGPDVATIVLDEPMSDEETAAYVHARLAHAGLSGDSTVRFDADTIAWIHRDAEGMPARVDELADEVLRPRDATPVYASPGAGRPESLAFALLSEAESESRISEWSDADLLKAVTSAGSAAPGRAASAASAGQVGSDPASAPVAPAARSGSGQALLTGALSGEEERPRRTGFASFLQTLAPSVHGEAPAAPPADVREEVEEIVAARLDEDAARLAAEVPVRPGANDAPERPRGRGLGDSILAALGQEPASDDARRVSDATALDSAAAADAGDVVDEEFAQPIRGVDRVRDVLRPHGDEPTEATPVRRPPANPVAERILAALRNPEPAPAGAPAQASTAGAEEARVGDADATHDPAAARILDALQVTAAAPAAPSLELYEGTAAGAASASAGLPTAPAAAGELQVPRAEIPAEGERVAAPFVADDTESEPASSFEVPLASSPQADATPIEVQLDDAPASASEPAAAAPTEDPFAPAAAPADPFGADAYDYSAAPPPLPSIEPPIATAARHDASAIVAEGSALLSDPTPMAASDMETRGTLREDTVLLPDPPPPAGAAGASRPIDSASVDPAPPAALFGDRDGGAQERPEDGALAGLAPGRRSLRSLGVFDGGRPPAERPGPIRLGSSEPASELASELARGAEGDRGSRMEVLALAFGIFVFAVGALAYWASSPATLAPPAPVVDGPAASFADVIPPAGAVEPEAGTDVPASGTAPTQGLPAVASTTARTPARESAAPVPTADEEPAAATGLRFWPPLPDDAPVAAVEPPVEEVAATAAVDAAPAESLESLEAPVAREPAEGRAIAGMRPPAAIAAPALAERVLPVSVRARSGATIEIDGVDRGEAPLFGVLLTEGTHRMVARNADGTESELLFEVDEQNLEVSIDGPASR